MRGAVYAIGEILFFLGVAALIGFAIGYFVGRAEGGSKQQKAPKVDKSRARELETKVEELNAALAAERQAGADSRKLIEESESLKKELSVAAWQIITLEDELAKRDAGEMPHDEATESPHEGDEAAAEVADETDEATDDDAEVTAEDVEGTPGAEEPAHSDQEVVDEDIAVASLTDLLQSRPDSGAASP